MFDVADRRIKRNRIADLESREDLMGWKDYDSVDFQLNGGDSLLKDAWNRLSKRCRSPLVAQEWYAACAKTFYPCEDLLISVLFERGSAVAILPLACRRLGGIRYAEMLGSSVHFEPAGFLYESADKLEEIGRKLAASGMPLKLSKLMLSKEEDQRIRSILSANGYKTIAHVTRSPWLSLDGAWEEYESSLSSSRRSSIRRGFRRLAKKGNVGVQVIRDFSRDLQGVLDEAFSIEASGWKGENGTAIDHDARLKRFFCDYAPAAARAGILRIFFLRVGGTGVAMVMAVEFAARLWILKIGFDQQWAFGSPGIVLMHETIKWAFSQNLEAYEFLGRDESWVHIWTDQVHEYVSYRSFPLSLKGFSWVILEAVRTVKLNVFKKGRKLRHV